MEKLIIFSALVLSLLGCAQTKKSNGDLSYKQKEILFATQNELASLKALRDPFYNGIAKDKCLKDWSGYVASQRRLLIKYKTIDKKTKVWTQLGSCYVFIGQYKNAFYYYDLALSFSGKKVNQKSTILSNIGAVYEKIGLPVMAESYYQRSLSTYPNNSFASFKLALGYLKSGDFHKGNKILKRLLKRFPKSRVLRSTIGVSFALLGDVDSLRNKVFPFYNEKDIEKVLFKLSIKVLNGKLSDDALSDLKDLEFEKKILINFQNFLIKEVGRKHGEEKV